MSTGKPIFRFRFIHSVEGTHEITEPLGWPQTKLILDRDPEYSSLVERFDGAFTFFGRNGNIDGGTDFIRHIENTYGIDADLNVDIDLSFDGGNTWDDVFYGLYDFSENEENNRNQIKSAIIRNDFWTKFINRSDTPVDIQSATGLDGGSVDVIAAIDTTLTSQAIPKTTTHIGDIFASDPAAPEFDMPTGGAIDASGASDDFDFYGQASLDLDQDEIDDSFAPLLDFLTLQSDIAPQLELPDEGGPLRIQFDFDVDTEFVLHGNIFADSAEVDPSSITSIAMSGDVYLQKNNDSPVFLASGSDSVAGVSTPSPGLPVAFTRIFTFGISAPVDTNITVSPGDVVKLYVKWTISFFIDVGADSGVIKWSTRTLTLQRFAPRPIFTIQSTFPETTAEVFLIHDSARNIIDRITDRNGSLVSEYMGNSNTSPSYGNDGCASNYVVTRGLQIRQYSLSAKPMQMSFKQWWDGANPVFNFGLGYTTDDTIEIERREDFFDENISVSFDYVDDIIRRYDQDKIFNKVEIGFQKWQSENISGIDDPQTKHSYATRFKKVGKSISILSDWIAASLSIETTRRAKQKKSADYKYDDETFLISVNASTLNPELDENFQTITGLNNSDTRYNIRLSPARSMLRWIKHFNGSLQSYIGSAYKFVSGEGNYDMSSLLDTSDCEYDAGSAVGPTVSEKEDMFVHDGDYIHMADLLEIKIPMSWAQYRTIRDNRKKAIGISRTNTGHIPCFIKTLEYEVCNSYATITAWPKNKFSIDRVETTSQSGCP